MSTFYKTIWIVMMATTLLLLVATAYGNKAEPPPTTGADFLMPPGSATSAKRKCLHGHTATPIPVDMHFYNGVVITIELCPVCLINTLQKFAGYPSPKENK